jgi:hypothetical protein
LLAIPKECRSFTTSDRAALEQCGSVLIRDGDRIYGTTRRLRAMGNRDKPTAPASPWQNGFAERLIGSIRHECVDHVIVLSEAHLRRIPRSHACYYNEIRTHRSLDKDAPVSRPDHRPLAFVLGGRRNWQTRSPRAGWRGEAPCGRRPGELIVAKWWLSHAHQSSAICGNALRRTSR